MLKKAYFYLKNDIEKERITILITEVIVFILFWIGLCFLYLTQSLHEIHLHSMESNPILTTGSLAVISVVFLLLFIVTSFCFGELIHRARAQIANNKLVRSQKGWMLLDSIAGMVILSTAVITLLLAFTQATRGTVASTNRTQATYLAQQALENLKAQDGNATITPPADYSSGIFNVSVDPLTVAVITDAGDHLNDSLEPYQVTVSWADTSGGSANKSITMVGYCYVVNP